MFALWGLKRREPALEDRLRKAADEGRKRIREIAASESPRVKLPKDDCERYLRERIAYDLGPAELTGLRLFERHARALGLLDATRARR